MEIYAQASSKATRAALKRLETAFMGDRLLLYFAAALSRKLSSKIVDQGSDLVGDTGIEPVTSSV